MSSALPLEGDKLASLLRECAVHVERDEWHPVLKEGLSEFKTYVRSKGHLSNGHSGTEEAPTTTTTESSGRRYETVSKTTTTTSPTTSSSTSPTTTAVQKPHHNDKHFGLGSLGKKFAQQVGLAPTSSSSSSTHHNPERASATSQKNAARAKADLEDLTSSKKHSSSKKDHSDWCEVHFCVGCQCQSHKQSSSSSGGPTAVKVVSSEKHTSMPSHSSRPAFQRPTNPKSTLIANGWIEQQRRSKMSTKWKTILASLVEGKKEGEETTLWIQREVMVENKKSLEALHQIPIKWVRDVQYLDYSTDHRFSVKVHNVSEDFLFRCASEEAAQNWVLTIMSVYEITARATKSPPPPTTTSPTLDAAEENRTKEIPSSSSQEVPPTSSSSPPRRMPIKELRALAHGYGINTAGMERTDLERVVREAASKESKESSGGPPSNDAQQEKDRQKREEEQRLRQREQEEQRLRQREQEEQRRRVAEAKAAAEQDRQQRRMEEEARQKRQEEERRQQEEAARRRQVEEQRRRAAAAAAAEEEARRRQQQQQAEEERRRQEEQRRRLAYEEEQRRRAAAEEEARRLRQQQQAAAAEEAQRKYQQQQQQWQQQQQQQDQWKQQQQAQQQWQQQQQQQQWAAQQRAQQQQQVPPPPQWNGGGGGAAPPHPGMSSPIDAKYAKMAEKDDSSSNQASITAIKRNLLVHWALQPPMLQMLRPIDQLLTSVHTVFPPAFGVAGHEYFQKWKPFSQQELVDATTGYRDDAKLKKAVRKLRFFLHPDKLPKDLAEDQTFMCKMLWDISNDAWEEFHKHKDELDWIRN